MERAAEKSPTVNPLDEKSINVVDIVKYLAFYWKWFVLSVLLFGGYYLYQYSRTSFMYRQSEVVMIKTPMNTPATARITRTNSTYNSVSVAGEILQLRSKELMRQTIDRIGGDISYTVQKRLRDHELYTDSPVDVKVLGLSSEDSYSVVIVPLDAKHILMQDWGQEGESKKLKVPLNNEVQTPFGKILITANSNYTDAAFGQAIRVTKYPREMMVAYYMNNLKIQQLEDDASLLQITMEDSSPKRAADLITTLITVYNEVSTADKNQIAINTASFIRERLAIIESELGTVETNIERLKTSNQGVDVVTAGQMYLSDSRVFQAERANIETDIELAEMMRDYLTNKDRQNDLIPNNTGLVDANVESQIVEYNSIILKRNRLVEGSSPANPLIKDMDRVLDAMRSNIDRAVDNALAGLFVKMQNVQKKEEAARGKALEIPEKQRVMLSVERQQKVKEELYLFLLNKREENALNQAMTEDNIRIIDPASGSYAPIYPSRFRKLLTGVGIGMAVPLVVLLLMLILDTGVRGRHDIESKVSAPFLGEIPLARDKKQKSGDVLVTSTGRDPLTEAFRILRTNINFMTKNGKTPKVITFTSFYSGVGKTFSVLNLSRILSFMDKKVIVLDLDLRKGTLSTRMNIGRDKGITHYLSSDAVTIEDIIHRSGDQDMLHFVPIGIIAPNPVELLLSKRLDELIDTLKERYDYILVDGVPVAMVADAHIIDRISELTLFVIRLGKMDRRQLPELEKIYSDGKLSNLAIILNGLKPRGNGYGYGYGYGYGNYGGYGYGNEKKKNILSRWLFKS